MYLSRLLYSLLAIFLFIGLACVSTPNSAYADKVCIKVKPKTTKKGKQRNKVRSETIGDAESCTKGYTELLSGSSFKGDTGAQGEQGQQGIPGVPQPGSTIYAVVGDTAGSQTLITFDSNNPSGTTVVATISGLAAGEVVRAIAFRPSSGALYALISNGIVQILYTIDINTAAATLVGNTGALSNGTNGFAINPVDDTGRWITLIEKNYSIDLDTGAATAETNIDYGAGDTNAGAADIDLEHIAYNSSGTIYGIASEQASLVTLAGSNGALTTIGELGLPNLRDGGSDNGGFDIADSIGYAALTANDGPAELTGYMYTLYAINLSTGRASVKGLIGNGMQNIEAMAIQPSS